VRANSRKEQKVCPWCECGLSVSGFEPERERT
jgi:hypothetical protein